MGANSSILITAIVDNVTTLQYLDLSCNNISDDTASLIGAVIVVNKYLYHLNLTNNQFHTHGITILLTAMSKINSLQCVNLRSYDITDELAVDLEEVAINNNGLQIMLVGKYAIRKC